MRLLMRTIRINLRLMIICICHRVSDRDIARSVREGCDSFEELQAELAVATGCGACHDCAQASFHEQRSNALSGLAIGPAHAVAPLLPPAPGKPGHAIPVRVLRRLGSPHAHGGNHGHGHAHSHHVHGEVAMPGVPA